MAVNSVTPAQQDAIAGLYAAFWNRAPDTTGFGFWVNKLATGAATLDQIATEFRNAPEGVAEYPTWSTNVELVTEVYNNVFGRAPDAEGLAFWTAKLTTGQATFPELVVDMVEAAETNGSNDGLLFTNKVTVGVYVATVAQTDNGYVCDNAFNQVTYEASSVATAEAWVDANNAGATYTLTTNIDTFTATHANAVFNAVADAAAGVNTMNSGDVLTGSGGINTLNVLGTGVSPGLVETNNIQNVDVRSVAASGFSQLLMNGVESVANNNSLATLAITNADLGTEYSLNNTVNTAANNAAMTVTYTNAAGTADQGNFVVNNAGTAAIAQSLTVATAAGVVETVAFDLNGTNNIALNTAAALADTVTIATAGTNTVALTAGVTVEQITVTGNGTNTVNVLTAAAAGLDFDASATTGSNNLTFAAGLIRTGTSIVGGSGADTLNLTAAAPTNYATPTISGVETFVVNQSAAAAATIGLGRTTGLTDINLTTGATNTGAITLQQIASGVDINIAANAALAALANNANALTITGSYAGAADVQNINIDTTADLLDGAGLVTTTALETLNYVVTGDADNFAATAAGVLGTSRLSALTVSTEGFTAANEVNVTLTSVGATGSTLDLVDLTGANTGVSVTFAAASLNDGAVVLGGSGNDTIDAALVAPGAGTSVSIIGGVGADTMTAATVATVFGILEGDSGITVATADNIVGFTTAVDSLALGVAGDATALTGNYGEAGAAAASFAAAQVAANIALALLDTTTLSTQTYNLQQVGADSYLFTDYNLDGAADSVVVLTGVTLAQFAAADITA